MLAVMSGTQMHYVLSSLPRPLDEYIDHTSRTPSDCHRERIQSNSHSFRWYGSVYVGDSKRQLSELGDSECEYRSYQRNVYEFWELSLYGAGYGCLGCYGYHHIHNRKWIHSRLGYCSVG